MKTNIIIKRLFFISLLLFTVTFVLTPIVSQASVSGKTDDPKYTNTGDETFDRLFREARDYFDKEQWKEAVEKFKQIVCDCPEKKDVDKAFYWMAQSYKKLKMYTEAQQSLERLLKNFPNSNWADDAQVLMLQLRRPGQKVWNLPSTSPTPYVVNGVGTIYPQPQLDREDEIRLAAFQSLLASDSKRGIEMLAEILRADSKSSETLKREVIRTLRSHSHRGLFARDYWVFEPSPSVNDTQNLSLLRDTLLRSFQNNSGNVKIRSEIIYSLIAFNDEQSVNYLSQLYSSESDKEIKKAIINAFGSAGTGFYSGFGVGGGVGGFYTPMATTVNRMQTEATLAQGRLEETRVEQIASGQNTAVVATAKPGTDTPPPTAQTTKVQTESKTAAKLIELRKIYLDKLMEITRTEKDLELRRLALSNAQRFSGWSTRDGIVELLSQMYDAENDEQFKLSVIEALSNMKQTQATAKLLSIAKNDKSDKLRLQAIYSLRGNKSPEVIKFLEDLIK